MKKQGSNPQKNSKYALRDRQSDPKDAKVGNRAPKNVQQKQNAPPKRTGDSGASINFSLPKKLSTEWTIKLANPKALKTFWVQEIKLIEKKFSKFVEQKYFVNKFGLLQVLLEITPAESLRSCYGFFLPSGCCKTVTSYAVEHFYSSKVESDDREIIRPLYSKFLSHKELEQHEGKYYVLRLSLRNIPYNPAKPFAETIKSFLTKTFQKMEPDMLKDASFQKELSLDDFIDAILKWLYTKHGEMILIIDEVDSPAIMYSIKNATSQQIEDMTSTFRIFLDSLADATSDRFMSPDKINYIKQVILFGIHQPFGVFTVFDSRTWSILTILNWKRCAPHFLFTKAEVENLLKVYNLSGIFPQIEKHYGNYNGEYFLPASIVACLKHNGELAMYKSFRHSYDILNLDIRWAECMLLEFIENTSQIKFIDTENDSFVRSIITETENPFIHYVFAGLLCIIFPKNDSIKEKKNKSSEMETETNSTDAMDPINDYDYLKCDDYELCAGNLKNLNIIHFFLERAASIFTRPDILNEIDVALQNCAIPKLTYLLNDLYSTFIHLELTNERAFHIAMKVFFYFVPNWKTKSEVEKGTVNQQTGASGRIDLRLCSKTKGILYVFELKHANHKKSRIPLQKDKLVLEKISEAWDQIVEKGYVTRKDRENFPKIYEVAVACRGKLVMMQAREHTPPST